MTILRKIFCLIFTSLIIISVSFSQSVIKQTFYDTGNTTTKEVYSVSPVDMSFYNGDYWLFFDDGRLMEKGYYSDNIKSGEWVKFRSDGKIEYSGEFKNNEFTGVQFSYTEDGSLDVFNYFDKSISIEKDSAFILNFINTLREDLLSSGYAEDIRMKDKYDQFLISTNLSDSTDFNLIINSINELSYSGIYYSTTYKLYNECLAKISVVNDSLQNFKEQNSDNIFLSYIDSLEQDVSKVRSSDSIELVINNMILLSDRFRNISGLIISNSKTFNNLTEEFKDLHETLSDMSEDIFKSKLDDLNNKYLSYEEETEFKIKNIKGDTLIREVSKFNNEMHSISTVFDDISSLKNNLENKFKDNYPVIYSGIDTEISNKENQLKKTNNFKDRLKFADELKISINKLNSQFEKLDSLQLFISEKYEPLKTSYLQFYPAIYNKEIKSLATAVTNYGKINILTDKILAGEELCNNLNFYLNALTEFSETDKNINELFPAIEVKYKEKYREIYKTEVLVMEKAFKRYKLLSGAISKTETGKQINEKILELSNNLDLMDKQSIEIQTRFPLISQKYQTDFPAIYKSDINIFEKKIDLYNKSTTSGARLSTGDEILKDIDNLELKFTEIKDQTQEINRKFSQVEGNYQIDFPVIYRSQIKDARSNIDAYNSEGRLNNKLTLGNIILERFDGLLDQYTPLKQEQVKITSELPVLVNDYKNFFPELYKLHIIDLIAVNKQYEGSGYLTEKSMLSKKLVKSIDELTEKYMRFKTQIDLISGLYNDFNLYY